MLKNLSDSCFNEKAVTACVFSIKIILSSILMFSRLIIAVLLCCLSTIGKRYFKDSNDSLTFATWQSSFADFG